ncbi:Glycoamylase-like domain-containing protein [Vibrio crassostreae]|nr:Glycoamylase-like domain-containing protein [Vibrio crassostreae]CAK2135501.1 Glycoamylase-like domain-containing protein [Vibrio crassostreae]CAK2157010.1 Glycoamylase-like domain-containing protein [Vibrio crassostreae]CAK2214865.1 Glycoamylase-like domain-containing protein [Vibrio crassostreae]CAK2219584.1 Glycoamylase-like domain-containing protein [Vibrio crassostreae]
MIKKSLLATCTLMASMSAFADVTITELTVNPQLYPVGFEQHLQRNLDFFVDGVGVDQKAKVPYDTIFVDKNGQIEHDYYVNTTEIGLYLNVLVEAHKNGNANALIRIHETLDALAGAPTWKGLFFWPYDIEGKQLKPNKDGIVPAVDNANLAFALAGVAGAYLDSKQSDEKEVVAKVESILKSQTDGWSALYDESRGLLYSGWSTKKEAPLSYHIDRKANESRLAPIWAHLITQNSENTVPKTAFNDMELYTQDYYLDGKKYSPMLTWDGAYFQGMLSMIWLEERTLIPDFSMIEDMTEIQKYHAIKHQIPFVSSAATVDDGYAAFGVPQLSESKVRFNNTDLAGGDTGTPHALALSYMVNPFEAVSLLNTVIDYYPQLETPYGWYDAINGKGETSTKILSLDQGMFVGAFLSPAINKDVRKYLERKNYYAAIVDMYETFEPNNK